MNDSLIIEELQSQISKKLNKVEKLTWFLKGYQCDGNNHITHLSIQKTRLNGEWPAALFQLQNLEYLNIQENNLNFIPEEITHLKKLKILDIRNNQISNLPTNISQLPNLEKLYLGQNNFEAIPESIKYCTSLLLIDFTENFIKDGCQYLLESPSIKNIYLRGNQIKSFPFEYLMNKQIEELNIQENLISSLPNEQYKIDRFFY